MVVDGNGRTEVVWITDLLPDQGAMVKQGMAVMKHILNRIAGQRGQTT